MQQDFSGQNLRGRSFKGQNLAGANFSCADIRSADFTGANLTGANFSGAKAGLQRGWAIYLLLVSWVLMGLWGFLSAVAGYMVAYLIFQPDKNDQIAYQMAGWASIITLVVFFFVTIRHGIQVGLGAVAGAGAVAVAVAISLVLFSTYISWRALKKVSSLPDAYPDSIAVKPVCRQH
jgi:Pentapeptide repeats (8 copies)